LKREIQYIRELNNQQPTINNQLPMAAQNIKNHVRILLVWHIILPLLLLSLMAMSIISLRHTDMHAHDLHLWLPLIVLPVLMLFIWGFARRFSLIAQDRAIRAEENLRHFILTGKPIDSRLRLGQIIALRFAPDEEFVELAKRAVAENLSPKEIKQSIKHWKADYHRV
jgi:hypothetical protein